MVTMAFRHKIAFWGRVLASASVLTIGAGANAATLSYVEGAVSVNRGNGYAPAGAGTFLAPGDRIRVSAGSADIAYENGCVAKVGAGQTTVVPSTPPSCGESSVQPTAETVDTVGIGIGVGLFAGGVGVGAILANTSSDGGTISFSP
ncbi:hypothetical protein Rvan_0386 [Rhodomicrobium vannielii ATCC 17100]|jgi:hypothetical protein|uniref:Uncharacterized protein n=1 Tax=Rhodomicrobium vannielii (strain ATCC 17100 / DSM 162 / LMG 4299 / NCIMB 10020 / ATH 3.1.1) TaxID=648757 RepID=E3I7Q6_RHOVT|nr:hypothetical protein Rvan_0386 [Rhodomicrobium vannielii ATCC 17100]